MSTRTAHTFEPYILIRWRDRRTNNMESAKVRCRTVGEAREKLPTLDTEYARKDQIIMFATFFSDQEPIRLR